MAMKWLNFLLGVVIVFTLTLANPVLAQEEQAEDIEDFSLEELLNVEITTAGKQAEKVSEIPASVVLVTREDIETYGYQNLAEILESIPGLYQTNDYFVQNFGVRGYWTPDPLRNIVVMVNDIAQTEGLYSANYLEQINIPVEAIDRVEVVRGPMSVVYGTGAFFGVINIKTNLVKEEKPINMIAAAAGSEKGVKVVVHASKKENDFQYSFSGSYYDTAGPDVDMSKMGPYTGTTKDQLESTEKYFNFSGKFKGFFFDASYTESDREIYILLPAFSKGEKTFNTAVRLFAGYEKKFSEKIRLDTRFGFFYNRTRFDQDLVVPNFYGEQLNGASGFEAELNVFWDPSSKVNLTIGARYHRILDERNQYTFPLFGLINVGHPLLEGESIITQAIFAQLNLKFSERFKIVAGARIEQRPEYIFEERMGNSQVGDTGLGTYTSVQATYSQTDIAFIPRLALIFSPNDQHYFKLLYGKAINRPSYFQGLDIVITPGRLQLQPETIQTLEMNYLGSFSSRFSVSLSLFYNMLDKLLFRTWYINDVGALVQYWANVGQMETLGAECTLKFAPAKSFQLELSASYQDTSDKRTGFEDIIPGYSPQFLGYMKASLFITKDISIAVTGNYVSEMESYFDSSIGSRLGEKVDEYFLLGANLRVRNLFGSGFFLNIRGSNLLDKEFFYPATSNSRLYAPNGTLGKKLSFLITMGYMF